MIQILVTQALLVSHLSNVLSIALHKWGTIITFGDTNAPYYHKLPPYGISIKLVQGNFLFMI